MQRRRIQTWLCTICNNAFGDSRKYRRHQIYVHTTVRFKCRVPGCKSKFKLRHNLIRHRRSNHPTEIQTTKRAASTVDMISVSTEEGILDRRLKLHHHEYAIINNQGRGDCLFEAVKQACAIRSLSLTKIRKLIVDQLVIEKWDKLKSALTIQHSQNPDLDPVPNVLKFNSREDYITNMTESGSLGSIVELCFAAKIFKFNFRFLHELNLLDGGFQKFRVENFVHFDELEVPYHNFLFTGQFNNGHWEYIRRIGGGSCTSHQLPNNIYSGNVIKTLTTVPIDREDVSTHFKRQGIVSSIDPNRNYSLRNGYVGSHFVKNWCPILPFDETQQAFEREKLTSAIDKDQTYVLTKGKVATFDGKRLNKVSTSERNRMINTPKWKKEWLSRGVRNRSTNLMPTTPAVEGEDPQIIETVSFQNPSEKRWEKPKSPILRVIFEAIKAQLDLKERDEQFMESSDAYYTLMIEWENRRLKMEEEDALLDQLNEKNRFEDRLTPIPITFKDEKVQVWVDVGRLYYKLEGKTQNRDGVGVKCAGENCWFSALNGRRGYCKRHSFYRRQILLIRDKENSEELSVAIIHDRVRKTPSTDMSLNEYLISPRCAMGHRTIFFYIQDRNKEQGINLNDDDASTAVDFTIDQSWELPFKKSTKFYSTLKVALSFLIMHHNQNSDQRISLKAARNSISEIDYKFLKTILHDNGLEFSSGPKVSTNDNDKILEPIKKSNLVRSLAYVYQGNDGNGGIYVGIDRAILHHTPGVASSSHLLRHNDPLQGVNQENIYAIYQHPLKPDEKQSLSPIGKTIFCPSRMDTEQQRLFKLMGQRASHVEGMGQAAIVIAKMLGQLTVNGKKIQPLFKQIEHQNVVFDLKYFGKVFATYTGHELLYPTFTFPTTDGKIILKVPNY